MRDQDWITGPVMAPIRRNFTVGELAPQARAQGMRASVLVQTVAVAAETPELLAIADGSDLVAGVVGWTDLTRPDVAGALAALRALPGGRHLVGIRHQVQGERDPRWLLRADVLRGLRAVARRRPGLRPGGAGAPAARPTRGRRRAAAAHLRPGPPGRAGRRRRLPGALDRSGALAGRAAETVCKLSGLVTEAAWDSWMVRDLMPYVRTALDAFGPGRVMFGSDWPVRTLAADYAAVVDAARRLTAALGEAERAEVFAGTATRVYGL